MYAVITKYLINAEKFHPVNAILNFSSIHRFEKVNLFNFLRILKSSLLFISGKIKIK